MRANGLGIKPRKRYVRTTDSNHDSPIYPNLYRNVIPARPDMVWVADFTYIRIAAGFCYLAVILDACSRKVVGYGLSKRLDTPLALAALRSALDCCDREAIAHVATTEGIKSEDVQDLVITAVENRFGLINTLPKPIEWLTDNGSCFIAKDTRSLLVDIGMEPCSTPIRSPQSNGMAEAFVKTFKRDYVSVNPRPDAATVIAQLPSWFEHYNTLHPHKALGYRSPREFLNRQTET